MTGRSSGKGAANYHSPAALVCADPRRAVPGTASSAARLGQGCPPGVRRRAAVFLLLQMSGNCPLIRHWRDPDILTQPAVRQAVTPKNRPPEVYFPRHNSFYRVALTSDRLFTTIPAEGAPSAGAAVLLSERTAVGAAHAAQRSKRQLPPVGAAHAAGFSSPSHCPIPGMSARRTPAPAAPATPNLSSAGSAAGSPRRAKAVPTHLVPRLPQGRPPAAAPRVPLRAPAAGP